MGGLRQKWDVIGHRGVGEASVLDDQSLFFYLLKKIGFAAWPDHLKLDVQGKRDGKTLDVDG